MRLKFFVLVGWSALLFSCAPAAEEAPSVAPAPSRASAETPRPTDTSAPKPDKWSLWINGTQLRGANVWQRIVVPELDGDEFLGGGYIGPPYTQEDFNELAALGANYVNFSLPGIFTERPPYELDERALANLDRMIEMAEQADLFVVLTFRTGPGRSDFTFYRDGAGDWFDPELLIESVWSDPAAQAAWAEMWRYAAKRYRDSAVVVGYDLMCEPNGNDVALGIYEPQEFYPAYAGSVYDWNEFYPRIAKAIREVDSQTPILVGGMGWSAVRWLPWLAPADDPRVVYAVHQYEPQERYTHQETPPFNSYPGSFDLNWDGQPEVFDRAWLDGYLSAIDDFKAKYDAPVAANEFGVMRWVPGAADFMRDEMALFERRGMNYAFWVWDPNWKPWSESVHDMNYRFGSDPENVSPTENELLNVIREAWSRNAARPSNFWK